MKLSMKSTTCSSDDQLTDTENQCRFLAFLSKFRRSGKILSKCMLLKSHEPVHAMSIKSGIVVSEVSIRACALKLEFGKV